MVASCDTTKERGSSRLEVGHRHNIILECHDSNSIFGEKYRIKLLTVLSFTYPLLVLLFVSQSFGKDFCGGFKRFIIYIYMFIFQDLYIVIGR